MLESLRLNLFGDASPAGSSDKSGPGLFSFGHKDESPADQFASWLPYISYLDEEQLFVNKDGMGFLRLNHCSTPSIRSTSNSKMARSYPNISTSPKSASSPNISSIAAV